MSLGRIPDAATIGIGSNDLAVIRDAEDHVVQKDIPLFKKA